YLKENIQFPVIEKPENHYINDINFGDLKTFTAVIQILEKLKMTAYQPLVYTEKGKKKSSEIDEVGRQKGIAKLMSVLLVKRLESSWIAFLNTLTKILNYHNFVLQKVNDYKKQKSTVSIEENYEDLQSEMDEYLEESDEFIIGKKNPIRLQDIEYLGEFETNLNIDIQNLNLLKMNIEKFQTSYTKQPFSANSIDPKLQSLITVINKYREKNPDRKILIFTVFRDTAKYIHSELAKRNYQNLGLITGEDNDEIEGILCRFAPYTKEYKEKDWDSFYKEHSITPPKDYKDWLKIVPPERPETKKIIDNPIHLLIATDVISEGQNLQDADCLINYDIHWNPVRLIQRIGRIDRIGSPHEKIYGINFWPGKNLEDYLKLIRRVESRMALGSLLGSEITKISSSLEDMLDQNESILSRQAKNVLSQLETNWNDIDDDPESFNFSDMSFESFRQELFDMLASKKAELEAIPNGVFSGFNAKDLSKLKSSGSGIMGLIGYPSKSETSETHKYSHLELFYISSDGNEKYLSKVQVLSALREHKLEKRFVPISLENPDNQMIANLKELMKFWMKDKFQSEGENDLEDIFSGRKTSKVLKQEMAEDRYTLEKYDLITWLVVSTGNHFGI
ncbi:MAG: hypothetical protein EBS19_06315, partial [Spirochaetia bacterium]|nr:hypothetical protein [Spirochaetia bacterium]